MAHGDVPPLMDMIVAHWQAVDTTVGGGGVVVLDGVDRGACQALRAGYAAKRTELVRLENAQELAGADVALLRPKVLLRLSQFNDTVRAWWGELPVAAAVPGLPGITAGVEKFLEAMRDALWLWDRLNAGPPPSGGSLTLPLKLDQPATFDRAQMAAMLTDLTTTRDAAESAVRELKVARAERDVLGARARQVLVTYARVVRARLGADHPLVESLPRLNPLAGHTPKSVGLTGTWDAERQAVKLEWGPTKEATLEQFQLRYCPGTSYAKGRERLVATLPPTGERATWVTMGLEAPGAVASYKLYVMLKTGNERGSPVVRVQRPAVAQSRSP